MEKKASKCGDCKHFNHLDEICGKFDMNVKKDSLFICEAYEPLSEEEKLVSVLDKDLIFLKIPETEIFVRTTKEKELKLPNQSMVNKIFQPKVIISAFTILFTFLFLLPSVYCLVQNRLNLLPLAISENVMYYLLVVLVAILIMIGKHVSVELDQMFHAEGNKSNIIQKLFVSKASYEEFSSQFFKRLYSRKIAVIAIIPLILLILFDIYTFKGVGIWIGGVLFQDNMVLGWISIISFNIIAFLWLVVIFVVFAVLVLGLRALMQIQKDKEKLSLTTYINNLKVIMFRKNLDDLDRNNLSASYYTFQRSSRFIGEFLFKVTSYFMILFITVSFVIFIIYLIMPIIRIQAILFCAGGVIFTFLSLAIFILPQIRLHSFLTDSKRETTKIVKRKIEELDNYFLLHYQDSHLLETINPKWKNVSGLKDEVTMLNLYLIRIDRLNTWAYNLPSMLKLIAGGLSSLIPLILSVVG